MFITFAIMYITTESMFTNAIEWSFGIYDVFTAALVGICFTLVDV